MMKFLLLVMFIFFMIEFNLMIMFYMNLWFLVSSLIVMSYLINSNNWVTLSLNFGTDKYRIYMILLSVCITGLMFLSMLDSINVSLKEKIYMFSASFNFNTIF